MLRFTQKTACLLIVQATLLVLTVLVFVRLVEAKAAYIDSQHNGQVCEQLTSQIQSLRRQGTVADEDQSRSSLRNAELVEIALLSGMSENQVSSIQRLTPLSIDGTDYERQDVSIDLRGVTMTQVLRLVLKAEDLGSASKVTSINLTSDLRPGRTVKPGGNSAETWNAQLILTRLVYLARSSKR